DSGVIQVGEQQFKGWKPGGHGVVNVISAIANSVNGFFYSISGGYDNIDGIGISGLDAIASKFGFGQKTEIDIPVEANGLLPTPEWKEQNYGEPWYLGDTYNAGIGQGFVLVTPLQLANATAAIANGGTLWWPHFGTNVLYEDGSYQKTEPRALTEHISDTEAIEIVRRGMRATVAEGTGRLLADLPVPAGGKTGTAQFGTGEPNAWFTAFAPYDEPTIAIAVLAEQAGEGSDFSAPVAKAALSYYFGKQQDQ
ncbi:MAG: penicillin-binding transpeptidase domain-containing protein, partial [bacterium]|nr:penicillin-binding transpeptidase domain-containing protein [bacterium]